MKTFGLAILTLLSTLFVIAQQQETKFTSQNNSDFARTISNKTVQLIDVRTAGEYAAGHIPNALNIDVQSPSFDNNASKLDKARPVAVYCRSGARSKTAAKKLVDKGFKVYELDRGINGWNGKTTKKQIK